MSKPVHDDTARLQALIRDGLGRAIVPFTGGREIDTLRIELRAGARGDPDTLAPEIVAAIARALGETE
jgi:hypothetical protein